MNSIIVTGVVAAAKFAAQLVREGIAFKMTHILNTTIVRNDLQGDHDEFEFELTGF